MAEIDEKIYTAEEIIELGSNFPESRFLAKKSLQRVREKIHDNQDFGIFCWDFKNTIKIIKELEDRQAPYLLDLRQLIKADEFMFEDFLQTEYELFDLGFGYRRTSVNSENDEKRYMELKRKVINHAKINEYFFRRKANYEFQIRIQFPEIFQLIRIYKELKEYLKVLEAKEKSTEESAKEKDEKLPIIQNLEKEVGTKFSKDTSGHYLCLTSLKKCLEGCSKDIKPAVLMRYIRKSDGSEFSKKNFERVLYGID
ncbi:MAG: hypothetical protein WCR31_12345 [Treponema sp.]